MQSVPGAWAGGSGGTLALDCSNVKRLLTLFAQGAMPPEQALDVEAHLASCADCARELKLLQTEDELLTDALAELRPDASLRSRVAQMCAGVQERAERVANTLPERGWAVFRWSIAVLAVLHFTAFLVMQDLAAQRAALTGSSTLPEERSLSFWTNLALFAVGIFLLIGGRLAAALTSRWGRREDPEPTRLDVLTLEALGILTVLATSVFLYFL